MHPGIKNKPDLVLFLLLSILWIANLFQSAFTQLHYDEAYYWMFAQNLDWGYFDHPPMVALLIKLGEFLPGESGVRFFVTLLQPVYLYLFWLTIKRRDFNAKDALIYFLVALAIPLLQINGFIATPDAPLMFFTVLFLASFKQYLEKDSWIWTILTGLCMGLLAYSKYHGAIVVISVIIANPSILKRGKTYFAAFVALLLLLPHFYWQYEHDFASFQYHLSDRSKSFKPGYVFEYIGNIWATLNPFLFPLFFVVLFTQKIRDRYERTILVLSLFFLAFFGLSTLRGHVQPQWVLPSSLGVLLCMVLYARRSEGKFRYVRNASLITILLFVIARLNLIFNWIAIPAMGFGYEAPMKEIHEVAGDMPVIMKSSYSNAALYSFYTGGKSNSQQEWSHRNSQYGFWNLDQDWVGKDVILESDAGNAQLNLTNGKKFKYLVKHNYIPTHKIAVSIKGATDFVIPHDDQRLKLSVEITNPYPFALDFTPQGGDGLTIECVIHRKRKLFYQKDIVANKFTLLPDSAKIITFDATFELSPGEYNLGFLVRDLPMNSWWANRINYKMEIQAN